MKKFILLLIILLGMNKLFAQQLALKNGEVFTIETRNKSKAEFNSDDQYTFQYKVLSSNDAEYKLEGTLLRVKSRMNLPNKIIRINSDSIRQTVFNSVMLLAPSILLLRPFTVVLSPKGKLIRVEGINELMQQAISRWHITSATQKSVKPVLDDFLSAPIKSMFFELPDKKITYRSVWANTDKINYEVIAIRGALLDIVAVSDDKTINARYTLNEVTGLLEDANVVGKYNIGNVLQQNNYSQNMITNVKSIADTAWLNMAIIMSNMSDALNRETALNYFKTHDELYKNDAYYISKKQYLKQRLKIYN